MTKKSNPSKPFKPTPETLLAVQSLQAAAEDDASWGSDENAQLKKLASVALRIDQLQAKSNYPSLIPQRTEEDLDNLVQWAFEKHNIDLKSNGLRIGFSEDIENDATFFATKSISKGSSLIAVPADAILSSSLESRQDDIQQLIKHGGPAISRSPSLILTLILLMECYQGKSSNFDPYIAALPSHLNTPFFNFNDDFKYYNALRPSTGMQGAAVRMLRAQLRDYCGVFRAVMNAKLPSLPISQMSLKNFRWAISIVMTRQNALPPKTPSPKAQPVMALIPLWDMFNHDNGKPTTSVTLNGGQLTVECSAMKDFNVDDPIKMCYGLRPSGQLALYCGFLLPDGTPSDDVLIHVPLKKLNTNEEETPGLVSEMQINLLKAKTLQKKGVAVDLQADRSYLCKIPIGKGEESIDKALGVAGVSVMTKSEFADYIRSDAMLPSVKEVCALERAEIAFSMLQNAIKEVLTPYQESKNLDVDWESEPGKLVAGLLSIESKLLENALEKAKKISKTQER